jgi:hypothetical protein
MNKDNIKLETNKICDELKTLPTIDVLSLDNDFHELRKILYHNEFWYGDQTSVMVCDDIELENDKYDSLTVMISFIRPGDKQLFLNIIIDGESNDGEGYREFFDNYFFTWYDNRAFEVATLNGQPITKTVYDELIRILKLTNLNMDEMRI